MKKPNIFFNWIPKCAGTSIFKFLKDEFGAIKINSLSKFRNFKQRGCVTFGHLSYIDLRAINLVQDSFHDNSYKFSFVRCPYSRSVSLYNYWINTRRMKSRVSFKDFMKTVHLRRGPIGIYNVNGLSQTNPQVDWLISGSGKFFTNKIYKIENLDDFIDDFSSRYKVNFCQKKKYNESKIYFSIEDLMQDPKAVALVNMIYVRDFHLLNYKMQKV